MPIGVLRGPFFEGARVAMFVSIGRECVCDCSVNPNLHVVETVGLVATGIEVAVLDVERGDFRDAF